VTVRPQRPGDVAAIRRVNEAAFGRAAEADLVARTRSARMAGSRGPSSQSAPG
jgi:predicted N-acetyltransferase YhbS